MTSLVGPIVWIAIGAVLFLQWRKARQAQRRGQAFLWGGASVFATLFGLLGLLGILFA